jgi:hypothetical protein
VLTGLTVTVSDSSLSPLELGVNESYVLYIPSSGNATLVSATLFGAYHGLETMSQLIQFDFSSETYVQLPRFPFISYDQSLVHSFRMCHVRPCHSSSSLTIPPSRTAPIPFISCAQHERCKRCVKSFLLI